MENGSGQVTCSKRESETKRFPGGGAGFGGFKSGYGIGATMCSGGIVGVGRMQRFYRRNKSG